VVGISGVKGVSEWFKVWKVLTPKAIVAAQELALGYHFKRLITRSS
jgi:hypothetical protein